MRPTERSIQSELRSYHTVGLVGGVLRKGEARYICRGRVRKGSSKSPDADTIFEIGSLTKIFTATLLLDLSRRRLLKLDDSVGKFLPDDVKMPEPVRRITIFQLATHTSGLPRMPEESYLRPEDGQHPFSQFSSEDLYRFLDEVKLKAAPGAQYSYSNLAYGLLGHILELRSGKRFQDLVESRICRPLGMKDTSTELDRSQERRYCQGYSQDGGPVKQMRLNLLAPAGGLKSSARDLLRLLRVSINPEGSRLVREVRASQRMQYEWPADFVSKLRAESDLADTLRAGVGFGWHIYKMRDSTMTWHAGGTRGFSSFLGFIKERRCGIVVLSNVSGDIVGTGTKALSLLGHGI